MVTYQIKTFTKIQILVKIEFLTVLTLQQKVRKPIEIIVCEHKLLRSDIDEFLQKKIERFDQKCDFLVHQIHFDHMY